MENNSPDKIIDSSPQNKKKLWPWILGISLSVIIIGLVTFGIIKLVNSKKNIKKDNISEEDDIKISDDISKSDIENDTDESTESEEEIAEYDKTCLFLQMLSFGGKEANSFEPRDNPKDETRIDGVIVKTEINYSSEFPNSYLDIYYPGPVEQDRPTFIYWHGGGHIFGDKNMGDPLSPTSDVLMHMFGHICKQGFNFISVNYCFAPEYRYPAQIVQYDKCLDYLNKHASELHLNMNNVVLGGGQLELNIPLNGLCF